MTPTASTPAPRRKFWRWLLLGLGLCLAPIVVLAIVAASYMTLDRDAAVLRKQVMAATHADWHTMVQMSIGSPTLGAIRSGLGFAHNQDVREARQALAAIGHASVGVYELASESADWSRVQLFVDTDRAMQKRGWTRLVGVVDHKDTVLVYVPQDMSPEGMTDICVAVVSGKELVVASTSVDAAELADFTVHHSKEDVKGHLRFAKLRL
jgi:hypothetical protein